MENNLQSEKEVIVLDAFLNEHDNTENAIANKTGLEKSTVRKIINKYIKGLKVNAEFIN